MRTTCALCGSPVEPCPEAINAASRVTGAWIGDPDDPLALDEVKRIPAMLRAAYAVDFPAAPRPDAGDGTGETGATPGGPHDG